MKRMTVTESKLIQDGFISTVQSRQDGASDKSNEHIQQRQSRKGQGKGNKNKRKGTSFEHRVAHYYTKRGFIVLRARGSLGPADLIAIRAGERDLFIQCKDIKSNQYDRSEMSEFASFCSTHNRRCIWAYNYHNPKKKRGRMKFINLETTPVSMVTKELIAR